MNCGPERGAADADQQHVGEFRAAGGDLAAVDGGGEVLDIGLGLLDFLAQFRGGRKRGIAQPVVADHALFVGVGDGAGLQLAHGGEGLGGERLHFGQEIVAETHPADIERNA